MRKQKKTTGVCSGRFVRGVNVRRDRINPSVWRDAPLPETVRNDGWIPRECCPLGPDNSKTAIWFTKGNTVGYSIQETGNHRIDGTVHTLGSLKGELVRVIWIEKGVLRLMVKGCRCVYVTYGSDGMMKLHGEMPELPWLHFSCVDERTFSMPVGSIALSGESNTQGVALTQRDEDAVSAAVLRCYEKLKARIAGSGYQMQPVFARYRLIDGGGGTILTGPKVLLSASGGVQCRNEAMLTSTDNLVTVSAGSMNAQGFRPALHGLVKMPSPWNGIVKRLVVELSAPLEVMDENASCAVRVANNGRDTDLYVSLPCVSQETLRQRAAAAMAHGLNVHTVVEMPFSGTQGESVVIPPYAIDRKDADPWGTRHPLRDAVSYDYVCDAGEWSVAAGERRERFAGFPAICFATGCGDGGWKALTEVTVTDADGSVRRYAMACSGDSGAPTCLSGILTFPDPAATSIRISISHNGKIISESYPLISAPDAGCAFWMEPDLKGSMPRGVLAAMPAQGETSVGMERRAGYIGVFSDSNLEHQTDGRIFGQGEIVCVSAAPRNNGSWDFSRMRLLTFGSEGTGVLTLDGAGRFHSWAPMDDRPVGNAEAVCRVSCGNGLTHLVIAGRDLLQVDKSGISVVLADCCASSAGWCGRHNEILLASADGGLRRMNPERADEIIESSSDEIQGGVRLLQWYGRQLIVCGNGTVSDTSSDHAGEVETLLELRMPDPEIMEKVTPMRTFIADICSESFNGTIGVYGDRGTEVPELLCEYTVSGAINSPLLMRIPGPRRRWLELHLHGVACRLAVNSGYRK